MMRFIFDGKITVCEESAEWECPAKKGRLPATLFLDFLGRLGRSEYLFAVSENRC